MKPKKNSVCLVTRKWPGKMGHDDFVNEIYKKPYMVGLWYPSYKAKFAMFLESYDEHGYRDVCEADLVFKCKGKFYVVEFKQIGKYGISMSRCKARKQLDMVADSFQKLYKRKPVKLFVYSLKNMKNSMIYTEVLD